MKFCSNSQETECMRNVFMAKITTYEIVTMDNRHSMPAKRVCCSNLQKGDKGKSQILLDAAFKTAIRSPLTSASPWKQPNLHTSILCS